MERQHVPFLRPRPARGAAARPAVPVLMRQALVFVLIAAFALLGGRPAAAPVGMPVAMASGICHDGASHQDHGDEGGASHHQDSSCLFCHLLGATGPQEPASAGAVLLIRFVRLDRPADTALPALRPLRRERARDPPRSGSVAA